ncbi:MAG: protogloblin ApPgb [Candidatus Eisenbacteria bacterium]|uniref:Protogloblin ApPgb n=1 Tax=Eiseniibacteriota bacterium TaxID=2212470 RepID=A0A956LX57_UNCEI|nr:protogloblin ApPgb [Candidatus Eisenbacteria bacterium]
MANATSAQEPVKKKGDQEVSRTIHGYDYGSDRLPRSPVTLEDFEKLKATVLLGEGDLNALRKSRAVLEPQVDEILDVWYGFVGSQPQLLAYFSNAAGKPDGDYLQKVRERFGQWILDTADARYDQAWLDYQYEIGRRHHRVGKNRADDADAVNHIHYRYLPALIYPVTATLKPFLEKGGFAPEEVEAMHQAWIKSVLLQVILWSQPYVREGDF